MNINNYVRDIEPQLEKNLYTHVAKQIQYNEEKNTSNTFCSSTMPCAIGISGYWS